MTDSGRKEKLMKKAERIACWGARDEMWKCWDKNGFMTPTCQVYQNLELKLLQLFIFISSNNHYWFQEFRDKYELECPGSWVVHFDRKYKYEKFKAEYMTKGYETIDKENQKSQPQFSKK